MTSDRPYRLGMPPQQALAILRANIGPQWDPDLVERFIPLIDQLLSTQRAVRPISLTHLRQPAPHVLMPLTTTSRKKQQRPGWNEARLLDMPEWEANSLLFCAHGGDAPPPGRCPSQCG